MITTIHISLRGSTTPLIRDAQMNNKFIVKHAEQQHKSICLVLKMSTKKKHTPKGLFRNLEILK